MSDDEIYDGAIRSYTCNRTGFFDEGNWHEWLTGQTDDVLLRLYTGLNHAEENTLVVHNNAELDAASTHGGRIVIRGENRIDEYYAWDDHLNNVCVLNDVTEVLRDRFTLRHFARLRRRLDTTQAVKASV